MLPNGYPNVATNLVIFLIVFLVNRQWLTRRAFNLSIGGIYIFFLFPPRSQRTIEEPLFLLGGEGWVHGEELDGVVRQTSLNTKLISSHFAQLSLFSF